MFWIGFGLGVAVGAITLLVISCIMVSGNCSRLEEGGGDCD